MAGDGPLRALSVVTLTRYGDDVDPEHATDALLRIEAEALLTAERARLLRRRVRRHALRRRELDSDTRARLSMLSVEGRTWRDDVSAWTRFLRWVWLWLR